MSLLVYDFVIFMDILNSFLCYYSGSYSPRFLGRKYVNPNMSRYRMRGPRSGMLQGEDDGDEIEYEEFSDDDVVTTGKILRDDDLDSEDSCEIGIQLYIHIKLVAYETVLNIYLIYMIMK